jgi:hypothetical protein
VPSPPPSSLWLPYSAGDDESKWLERMDESVGRLSKRLGGQVVADLRAGLRERQYAAVARQLIAYYDKLYDAHVLNGSGSPPLSHTHTHTALSSARHPVPSSH